MGVYDEQYERDTILLEELEHELAEEDRPFRQRALRERIERLEKSMSVFESTWR